MSHEIETHGDQAAAIFARTDAWHRLGTTVRGRPSPPKRQRPGSPRRLLCRSTGYADVIWFLGGGGGVGVGCA